MRIKRLELKAFGPFTDKIINFHEFLPCLHVIYGANEAGKSSTLRALKALLYGFPERTSDGFQHPNENLLVAGCLQTDDGREIFFQRRKRRKADLLDATGNPLDEMLLSPFLPQADKELFESLYGIDHAMLVQGGEDILAQKGEVGQALFAAGSGISSLRAILDDLNNESDQLFKARGTKPLLNTAISEYKEQQRMVKQTVLLLRQWQEHRRLLDAAVQERQRLQEKRDDILQRIQHFQQLKLLIPSLAKRKELRRQLHELGEVRSLPLDIAEKKRECEQQIRSTTLQLHKAQGSMELLDEKLDALKINKILLDYAEKIIDLHQRLGEYRKGLQDKIRLAGMRSADRMEAAESLKRVRPDLPLDKTETMRPVLLRKQSIQELITTHHALELRISQAGKNVENGERELQKIVQILKDLPQEIDAESLAEMVKLSRRAGTFDADIKSGLRETVAREKAVLADLKVLGRWSGPLSHMLTLPVPLYETVKKFAEAAKEIHDGQRWLADEILENDEALRQTLIEKKRIEFGGKVPIEEDLLNAREKRDKGWNLLRQQWISGKDVTLERGIYDPELDLPDAYEKYLRKADNVADRLRQEADRAAAYATVKARQESLETKKLDLARWHDELALREKDFAREWSEVWRESGVMPLTPDEMIAWLNGFTVIRSKITELSAKELEIKEKRELRLQLRNSLIKELAWLHKTKDFAGDELEPVLSCCETVLEKNDEIKRERVKFVERKEGLKLALEKNVFELGLAQKSLEDWQVKWLRAVQGLGMDTDIVAPADAVIKLDELQNCFTKLREVEGYRKRIDGIERDALGYETEVRVLLRQVAPDLLGMTLTEAVIRLQASLGKANEDKALLVKYREDRVNFEKEMLHAGESLQNLNNEMAQYMRLAGCHDGESLDLAITRSAEARKIKEMLIDVEATLAEIAAGRKLEDMVQEACGVDVVDLQRKIDSLTSEVTEELSPAIDNLFEVIGREKNELSKMDGSSAGSEAAEKSERLLARVRRLADRYVRVKLAAKILEGGIERYREQHQDPILDLAGKCFRELTLGSFSGLRADVDDNGRPILVGQRIADGAGIPVQGMSSGTRDQLYLSLRLASLEWHMRSGEAMPFIVDDILINFDDERVRVTLEVLAELAEKTQVIVFTHHRQVMEDARQIGKAARIVVHEL